MKALVSAIAAGVVLFSAAAQANLCKSVRKLEARGSGVSTSAATKRDVNFFEELFPQTAYYGDRRWNEAIVQCNRQRDVKGKKVAKETAARGNNAGKRTLRSRNLPAKPIKGKYNFYGTVFTQQKYVYVVSKKNGVWEMVIPYNPILNDVVKDRVDLNSAHSALLYAGTEVQGVPGRRGAYQLKSDARSLRVTHCSDTKYFPRHEGKYDGKALYQRDAENRFISEGKIDYQYTKDGRAFTGCRVKADQSLYYRADPGSTAVEKVLPGDWVLDNFVRTAEEYWSIDGVFRLRLLMKGRNEASFRGHPALDLLGRNDHLTVRFATKFLPYGFNQMYKSNPVQFNNFSTMTTDNTHWHEVGHAFGLDDEYGKLTDEDVFKENGCEAAKYTQWGTLEYQMCNHDVTAKRLIYHYIAVSRYVLD